MTASYSLDDPDTRDPRTVCEAVAELAEVLYGDGVDRDSIERLFSDVTDMFEGRFIYFQPMDVAYHNLEHTLQTVLCWARLVQGYQRHGVAEGRPPVSARGFHIGLAAVLLHDVGYLKEADDAFGSGAKFTCVHEQRSCELAQMHLGNQGWTIEDVLSVQDIIRCTGPHTKMAAIPFRAAETRLLGQMMCTADYLGQMSDPAYVDKLPCLFAEFEESDRFRGVPPERRRYRTYEELLRHTPHFWEHEVLPRLRNECGGIYRFLATPCPSGENPYLAAVSHNLERVAAVLEAQNLLEQPA